MQLGFQEGVGCTGASYTVLETINHMLERGSKVFSCFLDVRKAFDTVWIDRILYKLFSELGIGGRMWKVMKDLYTNVKAQVLYAESLSRKVNVSPGTGQSRILAPFMYKVHSLQNKRLWWCGPHLHPAPLPLPIIFEGQD